jgi:hypothetical protein
MRVKPGSGRVERALRRRCPKARGQVRTGGGAGFPGSRSRSGPAPALPCPTGCRRAVRWRSRRLARAFGAVHAFEEIADGDRQRLGNIPKAGRADAVHAGLVFLDLLELDADLFRQLLLGHANHPAAVANALADVNVNGMFHDAILMCLRNRILCPVAFATPHKTVRRVAAQPSDSGEVARRASGSIPGGRPPGQKAPATSERALMASVLASSRVLQSFRRLEATSPRRPTGRDHRKRTRGT